MPTQATQSAVLTAAQFHAMFAPSVGVPTPEEQFAHQAGRYLALNLGVQADVDRFHDILPPSGAVLCMFRKFRNEELADLMSKVVVNDKRGANYLDLSQIEDEPWVPNGPHMLTDVRDGRYRLNTKPSVSRAAIAAEGRKGNAAVHLVHWGLYYGQDILTHHYLDGVASRYKSGGVPFLCLFGGKPKLNADWVDNASSEWGAPCGGGVVVPRT
ncbi:MAG: hypothetical protein AAB601_00895 [Patescibacteria group bacterium]